MGNKANVVGEPTQTEINGKRFYLVNFEDGNSRLLRSVTTVTHGVRIPSFLDEWEKQQVEALGVEGFKAAMKQSAEDGTLMHKLIENHTKGTDVKRTFDVDDDVWGKYESYLRWEEKRHPTGIWEEKTLFSLQYGFAGRSDRKAIIDGRKVIIDYKSAKRAQDGHKEQGSAYYIAEREMGEECDAVLILALGAENKQGFTETWLEDPYDIHQNFMRFYHKLELLNFSLPL